MLRFFFLKNKNMRYRHLNKTTKHLILSSSSLSKERSWRHFERAWRFDKNQTVKYLGYIKRYNTVMKGTSEGKKEGKKTATVSGQGNK